jgi:hypothetical protein
MVRILIAPIDAGMTAGFVATVLSNPLDVVSTRLMATRKSHAVQRGTLETIYRMWQREGLSSFYKGFGPNMLRIGSFNVVLWLSYEQIRRIARD